MKVDRGAAARSASLALAVILAGACSSPGPTIAVSPVMATAASTPTSTPQPTATAAVATPVATSAPIATPASGGTLRVGLVDFSNPFIDAEGLAFLDPSFDIFAASIELFRCCLVRTPLSYSGHPTEQGGTLLLPDLADGQPQVSQDGRTWTFHLKPGIRYAPPLQDRTVTARDIVRALHRFGGACVDCAAGTISNTYAPFYVIEGFAAFLQRQAGSISGLETPDDQTLVVRVNQPSGTVGYLLSLSVAAPIPPSPTDPTAAYGIADGQEESPFGPSMSSTGPYMIEGADRLDYGVQVEDRALPAGYLPHQRLTLVRNPSWERATDSVRAALVDRMEFVKIDDAETGADMVASGALDVVLDADTPTEVVQAYLADPARASRVLSGTADTLHYLTLNTAQPPLDDLKVRRAINYVVDRAALAEARRTIAGQSGDVFRHAMLDAFEDNLLLGYEPYKSGGDHGDVEAGRREMAGSSHDSDGDGRCDGDGCTVVALVRKTELHQAMGARVVEDLAQIGLKVEIIESEDFFGDLGPGKAIGIGVDLGYAKDYPAADSFVVALYQRPQTDEYWSPLGIGMTRDDLRAAGLSTTAVPLLDDRLAECLALVGQAQLQCWAQLDQHIMERVAPIVPYFSRRTLKIVSDRVAKASFDQFASLPALDQFVLREGSTP